MHIYICDTYYVRVAYTALHHNVGYYVRVLHGVRQQQLRSLFTSRN